MTIRPARVADSLAAAEVVRQVYAEFGFTWEPDGYHADLYDLASGYLDRGHEFWVAENDAHEIIGTVALELFAPIPGAQGTPVVHDGTIRIGGADCSIERLYVISAARGGTGTALMQTAIEEARRHHRACLEIWSDKRFEAAHRLYRRLGGRQVGERICGDPDQSPEWGMVLAL